MRFNGTEKIRIGVSIQFDISNFFDLDVLANNITAFNFADKKDNVGRNEYSKETINKQINSMCIIGKIQKPDNKSVIFYRNNNGKIEKIENCGGIDIEKTF